MSEREHFSIRSMTERLAAAFGVEDQTVQSMPDVSPTKRHRAKTTWFFETFVLDEFVACYQPYDERYRFLFNSCYEGGGPRHAPPERASSPVRASRRSPPIELTSTRQWWRYSVATPPRTGRARAAPRATASGAAGDGRPARAVAQAAATGVRDVPVGASRAGGRIGWIEHDGDIVEVGHGGNGFAVDNEGPRHDELLRPFSDRDVTRDRRRLGGGYRRPELGTSDGWATVQANGRQAPEYWERRDSEWWTFGLYGAAPLVPRHPVVHLSCTRPTPLPAGPGSDGGGVGSVAPDFSDAADTGRRDGSVWQWTASPYTAYLGFRPSSGAVGEYNGKFMVTQQVLRGSGRPTPPGPRPADVSQLLPRPTPAGRSPGSALAK